MDILNEILKEHKDLLRMLAGKKLAICLHLEAKTAYIAYVISQQGADVTIAVTNSLSTQNNVAAGTSSKWYNCS